MKKRIISIVLLVVLLCSLALTVSAECDHTYMLIYIDSSYIYYSDVNCQLATYKHYTCTQCGHNISMLYNIFEEAHAFSEAVYVGTFGSGVQWWYHDCTRCGVRIDFYIE